MTENNKNNKIDKKINIKNNKIDKKIKVNAKEVKEVNEKEVKDEKELNIKLNPSNKEKNITSSLVVKNTTVVDLEIKESKELLEIIDLMKSNGVSDPKSLLPTVSKKEFSFELHNTNSSFANAVRRVLITDINTKCLDCSFESIDTDDRYILVDVLTKNINMIPIYQDINTEYKISIDKFNDTNKIIDLKASDIIITNKGKQVNINELIPNTNIALSNLRPSRKIKIHDIKIINGTANESYSKFTSVGIVKYDILDVEPYNIYDNTGQRSINSSPSKFKISFVTNANVEPKYIMKLLVEEMSSKLLMCKDQLIKYRTNPSSASELKIYKEKNITVYRYEKIYITYAAMLAHKCYELNKNILLSAGTVYRYDSNVGIIKIDHSDPDNMLLSAIDACLYDVKLLL